MNDQMNQSRYFRLEQIEHDKLRLSRLPNLPAREGRTEIELNRKPLG